MPRRVLIAGFIGHDRYSQSSYSPDVEYVAFIENKQRIIRDVAGREVVSNATIYLDRVVRLTLNDRITLEDGSTPPIVSAQTFDDEYGPYVTVVYT